MRTLDPQPTLPPAADRRSTVQEDPWRCIAWDTPSPLTAGGGGCHATQRLPDLLDWGALPDPSRGEEGTAPWNRKTAPLDIRMEELAWPFTPEPDPPMEAAGAPEAEALPESVQGLIEDAFTRLEEAITAGQPQAEAQTTCAGPEAGDAGLSAAPRPARPVLPLLAGAFALLAGGVLLDRFVLLKAFARPAAPTREAVPVPVPLASIHARATSGDREAMRMLALCFAEGLGVTRSPEEAAFWRRLAEGERPGPSQVDHP